MHAVVLYIQQNKSYILENKLLLLLMIYRVKYEAI